jgi:hypothetical protein
MPITNSFKIQRVQLIAVILLVIALLVCAPKASAVNDITFPVLGGGRYSNDFNASRTNGLHHATDIFAPKHTPIVSPTDGTIYYVMNPQPSWGYSIGIRDSAGYEFRFLHLNNDNDGTDDGRGGPMKAYGPDMKTGNKVVKGQFLGWVGDSGNAEETASHLHFEIYDSSGNALNPYEFLRQSHTIYTPAAAYPIQQGEALPYGATINTKVQVAAGNFDSDTQKEYVTGTGIGSTSHIKVFNTDHSVDYDGFFAYGPDYTGGVDVAAGDVDGDGIDEIITGTGPGSTTHVRIFKKNGQAIGGFFAYDGFYTGVNVTAGDVDGDGIDEIITGTGPGSTTHIKVFKLNGQLVTNFFAYEGYYVGADVASGDVDGDGRDEIVTVPALGSTQVKIFNPSGGLKSSFFAYDGFYGGTRIDVGNVRTNTAKEEIVTVPYSNGVPDVRMFSDSLTRVGLYEVWWTGGYDVAAGEGFSVVGTGGNRRASVRTAF